MKNLSMALLVASLVPLGCHSPDEALPDGAVRHDLRTLLGASDVEVVSVSIDPAGRRYVLDATRGIYELTESGARHVASPGGAPVELASPFTDMAALGDTRFALIARNEGYLFETTTGELSLFFCYVPRDLPGDDDPEEFEQYARNLAFDPVANRLYTQPQTFAAGPGGALLSAQVGVFDVTTGADLQWYELPSADISAGGLVVESQSSLLLAQDGQLSRFSLTDGILTSLGRLDGVHQVEGLALDRSTRRLLLVDGVTDELVELPLDLTPLATPR